MRAGQRGAFAVVGMLMAARPWHRPDARRWLIAAAMRMVTGACLSPGFRRMAPEEANCAEGRLSGHGEDQHNRAGPLHPPHLPKLLERSPPRPAVARPGNRPQSQTVILGHP